MELLHDKKILIIAPHQDDEVIGCGGLIEYALRHNSTVQVVHVFAGSTGIAHLPNGKATSDVREAEAKNAADVAGFTLLDNLGFLDRTRPLEADVQAALVDTIRRTAPEVVLLPHAQESDAEHAFVSRIGKEASWLAAAHIEIPQQTAPVAPVKEVLYYSVWTPLQTPRLYLDITAGIDAKRRMLACYPSQMGETSWEDGSTGINAYWGAKLQAQGFAEVFDCEPISIGEKNV